VELSTFLPFLKNPAPTPEDCVSMDAMLSQAESLFHAQRFEEGRQLVSLVKRSKMIVPPEVQDRADSILCESYVDSGKLGKAISLANRIVRRNRDLYPDALAKAIMVRAAVMGLTGAHKKSVKEASKVIDGTVKTTLGVYLRALLLRASMRFTLEDRGGALEDYDELVSTVPRDNCGLLGTVLVNRALVRWRTDDDEIAKRDAAEGAAMLSQVDEGRRHLVVLMQGFALAVQGEWLEAITFFTQCIDQPTNALIAQFSPYLRLARAHCHEQSGGFAEAVAEYQALSNERMGLKFFDVHFVVEAQLCLIAMKSGESERALEFCERALKFSIIGPMRRFRPYLRYIRAYLRIKLGRLREARSDLRELRRNRYIGDQTLDSLTGFLIAMTHVEEGDYQKALEAIKELLDGTVSLALRARCLAMQGILKHFMGASDDAKIDARRAAEMALTEELKNDPLRQDSDRLFDNPDEWTELFAAASSDAERARLWLSRAIILFTSERWHDAAESFGRVIKNYSHCKREYLLALELRYHYCMILGEYSRAQKIQKQIIEAEAVTLCEPANEIIVSKFLGLP